MKQNNFWYICNRSIKHPAGYFGDRHGSCREGLIPFSISTFSDILYCSKSYRVSNTVSGFQTTLQRVSFLCQRAFVSCWKCSMGGLVIYLVWIYASRNTKLYAKCSSSKISISGLFASRHGKEHEKNCKLESQLTHWSTRQWWFNSKVIISDVRKTRERERKERDYRRLFPAGFFFLVFIWHQCNGV